MRIVKATVEKLEDFRKEDMKDALKLMGFDYLEMNFYRRVELDGDLVIYGELYDDAIAHYQKAISLNPDPEWTSIVCQALGAIYAGEKGNIEAAVSTYQAGIILDPNNYDLYIALGSGKYAISNVMHLITKKENVADKIIKKTSNKDGFMNTSPITCIQL